MGNPLSSPGAGSDSPVPRTVRRWEAVSLILARARLERYGQARTCSRRRSACSSGGSTSGSSPTHWSTSCSRRWWSRWSPGVRLVSARAITRRAGKHWALLSVPNDVRAACRRYARYAPRW